MRFFIASLILFLTNVAIAAPTANKCRRFFLYPDGTTQLISYLESLEHLPQLQTLLSQLIADGVVFNPISQQAARVNVELQIHRKGLQSILDHHYFDLSKLAAWAESKTSRQVQDRKERAVVDEETKNANRRLKLTPPFELPGLNYAIQIMDSPVTQEMWLEHFYFNPVMNPDWTPYDQQKNAPIVQVHGMPVRIFPGYPVCHLDFWSAIAFANAASKKMGLPEAYDLKNIKFKRVEHDEGFRRSAGGGTLEIEDDPAMWQTFVRQNSQEELIARSGLRLPTPEEFETIIFQLSHMNGVPYNDLSEAQLKSLTSGKMSSHPIGSTDGALMIGSHVVDDLIGNVSFWSTYSISGGQQMAKIVGKNHLFAKDVFGVSSASFAFPTARSATGIILVRTVKP